MRRNWFFVFIICAICLKFIMNWLIITAIFSVILGVQKNGNNTVKTIVFGLIMGIESAVLISIFSASTGLSRFLSLFHAIGFPISDNFSYGSVVVLSMAYIVVFELIFVVLVVRMTEIVVQFLHRKGVTELMK